MTRPRRNQNSTPDVPEFDFTDTICEIWSTLSYAAYHLAYLHTYLQSSALRTPVNQLRNQEQCLKDVALVDVLICRDHLATFFWQIDHVFEALKIAITRGQKEFPSQKIFWKLEKKLAEIEQTAIRREINAYRNLGHEKPGIIGCAWDRNDGHFLHHHLPTLDGYESKESIDLYEQLQRYFEFAAANWRMFVPKNLEERFSRDFKFPVTVPNFFAGELPPKLQNLPFLEVCIKACDLKNKEACVNKEAKVNASRRDGHEEQR